MSELRFDGQVALVTGGGKGIGEAISRSLAARGAKVVVNGNYRPDGRGPEHALGVHPNGEKYGGGYAHGRMDGGQRHR